MQGLPFPTYYYECCHNGSSKLWSFGLGFIRNDICWSKTIYSLYFKMPKNDN